MNKTTQTICQLALDQYRQMDGWATLEDLYATDPKTYLTEMADELVSLEMDGSDEKTGEMFPDWCSLVVTSSIEKTIDWESVRTAVIEMYEDYFVEELFGEDW